MNIRVHFRSVAGDKVKLLLNALVVAVLLFSFATINPLYRNTGLLISETSGIIYTTLIVIPNSTTLASFPTGPIPRNTSQNQEIINYYVNNYYNFIRYAFDERDVSIVSSINDVDKVVRGLMVNVRYYSRIDVDVNRSKEKYLAAPPDGGVTGKLLAIEATKVDFLSDFNNIVYGDFITPGSNEVLINKLYSEQLGVSVGSKIKIYFGMRMYEFKVVGIFMAGEIPLYNYHLVADLDYITNILSNEYRMFLDKYIRSGEWPSYTRLYVTAKSIYRVHDVANEINGLLRDDYPGLGINYYRTSLDVMANVLRNINYTYMLALWLSTIPLIGALAGLRILDIRVGRKYIALLKAIGWSNKDILAYTLVQTIVFGIVGGVLATILLYSLTPLLRGALVIEPSGAGFTRNIVKKMLENLAYNIPDPNFAILAPVLGIAVFMAANIGVIIYYLNLEPSKVLREV